MSKIGYFLTRMICRLRGGDKEIISNYFRKKGCIIGTKCNIGSDIATSEAWLIEIGNNVTISSEVLFVTHDASIGKVVGKKVATDLCGKIVIGNNCFIGARSTVLYGVELADNIIIAAGSVVTKSCLQKNVILGGNPAQIIGNWSEFAKKNQNHYFALDDMNAKEKKKIIFNESWKLINR